MTVPYSARAQAYLIEAVDAGFSHAKMGTLVMKAGLSVWAPSTWANKADRLHSLLQALVSDSTPASADGAVELARLVLIEGKAQNFKPAMVWWEPLKAALTADGLDFDETHDQFVPTVPGAPMAAEIGWIDNELARRGWTTAAGHYHQAVENFAAGRWASANSQLRVFFEDVVRTAGGTSGLTGLGQTQRAIDNLDQAGHLMSGEPDFAKKLWNVLHAGGSHPGLSDEDESRFRLLTLTGYVRYLLVRLP